LGRHEVSEPALSTSGGVILFLIALRMTFPGHDTSLQEHIDGEAYVGVTSIATNGARGIRQHVQRNHRLGSAEWDRQDLEEQ
jgi:hypothetical protein